MAAADVAKHWPAQWRAFLVRAGLHETISQLFIVGLLMVGNSGSAFSRSHGAKSKKLIEFGWDEPDTAFLRKHSAKMDRTPFDGCVFHINYAGKAGQGNFTWEDWGKRAFTMPELQASIEDLKALSVGKLRHNFLRFNVTPGDLDWFDDFSAVVNNASLAAKVAKSGPCDGILFDIEQYKNPLFEYARQRNASSKSWREYAQQAKLRGHEVMQAFQSGFPNLKVFLTYGYSLPWEQSQKGKVPLSQTEYGLLAPFLDGMLEAVKGKTKIIDGFEIRLFMQGAGMYTRRLPGDEAGCAAAGCREEEISEGVFIFVWNLDRCQLAAGRLARGRLDGKFPYSQPI